MDGPGADLAVSRSYEPRRDVLTAVQNSVDEETLSRYDYSYDAGARRSGVAAQGTAFEAGSMHTRWGYNGRSELTSALRYFGTNTSAVSENVSEYLAEDGSVAAHYEYGPFGQTVVASGSASMVFPHRFSTKFLDDESGLYYYGLRFYSAWIGRWLSRDPLGEQGGMHLYAFIFNKSVDGVDPVGQDPHLECEDAIAQFREKNKGWDRLILYYENPAPGSSKPKCLLNIGCQCCPAGIGGSTGHGGEGSVDGKDFISWNVKICEDKGDWSSWQATIAHEIQHYFDFCSGGCDKMCENKSGRNKDLCNCKCMMCMEMRSRRVDSRGTRTRDQIWDDMMGTSPSYFGALRPCQTTPPMTQDEKNDIKSFVLSSSTCQEPWESGGHPGIPEFPERPKRWSE